VEEEDELEDDIDTTSEGMVVLLADETTERLRGEDDTGGTQKQDFSFLVPNGGKGLSNRPETALLPPRQPLEGAGPAAISEACGGGGLEVRCPCAGAANGVPSATAAGRAVESFDSWEVIKAVTRCRSSADNVLL
jgi:hypothetical protein